MTAEQVDAWIEASAAKPLPFAMIDFMRTVSISEYQVCRKHPGLTVQEAVAMSGGY
ncbi:MAG: hypothetical protein U1E34_10955 [Amaricoccus sp.]